MTSALTLDHLEDAVRGTVAALSSVTRYQPAGGPGDKVFPPTYEGGKYALELRRLPDRPEPVPCVLLDSVQSQANRMELALLDAWEAGSIRIPVISVQFPDDAGLEKVLRVTSLEAPHRIADALLRDSELDGTPFRKSERGRMLDHVDVRNATALFELCPTALIFGMWDSTGPKGGLGAKFQRAVVSEIIGIGVEVGVKTSSRIDPLQIQRNAGPLYHASSGHWTRDESKALKEKGKPKTLGKDGRPSEANHGNIAPSITEGGVTLEDIIQTTVISLPAIRRLRFPLNGKTSADVDAAARTALVALALCAATLAREEGCDLRSRCLLAPTEPFEWAILGPVAKEPQRFQLTGEQARELLKEAASAAVKAGLPWMTDELVLSPSVELTGLVKRSQELASQQVSDGGE